MEGLSLQGWVEYEVRRSGRIFARGHGRNLVTTAGKNLAALVLKTNSGAGPAATSFIYGLGFGDSANAPDEAQVALQGTEFFLPRPVMVPGNSLNVLTMSLSSYVNAGSSHQIREWGLFSASTAGIMVARFLPNEFTFANGDTVSVTWSLEIG